MTTAAAVEHDEEVVGSTVLVGQLAPAGVWRAPGHGDVCVLGQEQRVETSGLYLARQVVGANGEIRGEHLHADFHALAR